MKKFSYKLYFSIFIPIFLIVSCGLLIFYHHIGLNVNHLSNSIASLLYSFIDWLSYYGLPTEYGYLLVIMLGILFLIGGISLIIWLFKLSINKSEYLINDSNQSNTRESDGKK